MPRTIIPHVPIDSEWAETLVGLHLNIPNKWWPGFCDGGLNCGKIAAINLDPSSLYYFEVELNDEPGVHYAMRYDSVLLYVDDDQPGFARFCLPSCCPANPDDEITRVGVPKKSDERLMITTPTKRRQLNSTMGRRRQQQQRWQQ
jgi:hypothetical protein